MSNEPITPDLTEEERFALFVTEQDEQTDKPKAKRAEPEAAKPEKPDAGKPDAPPEPKPDPFPGYSALSEEGRKAVDEAFAQRQELEGKAAQLEQRYRAQQGQLAPAQKKAAELERQHLQLLARVEAAEKVAAERSKQTSSEAHTRWKELYPDEAAALEEGVFNPLQEKIARLEEQLAKVGEKAEYAERTTRETVHLRQESNAVLDAHPDAPEIIKNPAFDAWLGSLDDDDRAMASSKDARHAIKTLNNFKRDNAYAELLVAREGEQKTAPTASKPKPRLDVEPNPRNRQSPAPRGNAFGSAEEEAWANFLAERESRAKA